MSARKNEKGFATLLILTAVTGVIALSLLTLKTGLHYGDDIQLQTAADAAATSGALWEARAYNLIAAMNEGILMALTTAFTALATLIALKLCAASVVGTAACALALASSEQMLLQTASSAWETAVELGKMERYVVKIAPVIVLGVTHQTATKNSAVLVAPYPYVPESLGGSHDDNKTITLHTKDGGFAAAADKALEKLFKDLPPSMHEALGMVLPFADTVLRTAGEDPDCLILDDDFSARIKHGVATWKPFPGEPLGLRAYSQARPFLPDVIPGEEDLFDMNWHAKLVPVTFLDDF